MELSELTNWGGCPQKDLRASTKSGLAITWAKEHWDPRVRYAREVQSKSSVPSVPPQTFLRLWARYIRERDGKRGIRSVLANFRKIEKEIELTPEQRVRWDEAVEPLISASREALTRELLR